MSQFPTFTSFTHPLMLEGEPVDFFDPMEDLFIEKYCPDKAEVIKADIWPYLVCFQILKTAGQMERISEMNSDEPFKVQVRKMFPEVKAETRNYIRRFIAERVVMEMFFQNIWFDRILNESLGLPTEIVLGSEVFNIWYNFVDCSLKSRQSLTDVLNMTNNEHLAQYRQILLRASSEIRLMEIHDEVTKEYNIIQELIEAEKLQKPFPEPLVKIAPIPGKITRLSNGHELLQEGRKMHHCVASYVDTCLRGESDIYHVVDDFGKEATLELGRQGSIKQFKSFHNETPSPGCQALVSQWLKG